MILRYNKDMKTLIVLILCIVSYRGEAQDERFYRNIFNGKLYKGVESFVYKIKVESPKYTLDLNRDGIEDSFQTIKKDGVDFIRVNDPFGNIVFESALMTKGKNSKIFKAHLKTISNSVDVLILHFYEGDNEAAIFEGSGRLYFVTIRDRNLKKITLTKGPYFWTEKERAAGKYWNKRYSVNVLDYNKDGQKEISVSYNKSSQIYFYISDGLWDVL
ncbi:MAG: hypothetical protein ACJAS4_000813 [Bacteriovoracaceae bacterium]